MTVLHVEDNDTTRASLAHLVGVRNGRVEGHTFISTAIVAAALERLNQGTVNALVLDVGLDPRWDNKSMHRALRNLIRAPEHHEPADERGISAHRLALLARTHGVPCALLTNWADLLSEADGYSQDALRDTFHAEAVFRKDEAGMEQCAAWVRRHLD